MYTTKQCTFHYDEYKLDHFPSDGSNTETGQAGFPLSSFLRQYHFSVSRNATMVAQQVCCMIDGTRHFFLMITEPCLMSFSLMQAADRVASQTKV